MEITNINYSKFIKTILENKNEHPSVMVHRFT